MCCEKEAIHNNGASALPFPRSAPKDGSPETEPVTGMYITTTIDLARTLVPHPEWDEEGKPESFDAASVIGGVAIAEVVIIAVFSPSSLHPVIRQCPRWNG